MDTINSQLEAIKEGGRSIRSYPTDCIIRTPNSGQFVTIIIYVFNTNKFRKEFSGKLETIGIGEKILNELEGELQGRIDKIMWRINPFFKKKFKSV
jgi:hypothetical protein